MGVSSAIEGAIRSEQYLRRVQIAHRLMEEGHSTGEIANTLGVTETTVKRYFRDWSKDTIDEQIKVINRDDTLVLLLIILPFILLFIGIIVLLIAFG